MELLDEMSLDMWQIYGRGAVGLLLALAISYLSSSSDAPQKVDFFALEEKRCNTRRRRRPLLCFFAVARDREIPRIFFPNTRILNQVRNM